MAHFLKNITYLILIITIIHLTSCNEVSRSYCDTIMNISYSENDTILEDNIIIAENCVKKYHKNIELIQKTSQIYYIDATNKYTSKLTLPAAEAYLNALKYANMYFIQKKEIKGYDFQFRAEIYERLGDLYNKMNTFKPTAELYDKALSDYRLAQNDDKVANMLIKIGKLYRHNHLPDIAMIYFEMAEEIENIPINVYRKIIDNKLVTLYELNDYKSADSIFHNHFNTKIQDFDYHLAIGTKYFYERNYKSALPHLTFCFDNGTLQEKISASEKLAEAYFNIKDNDNELIYIQYQANTNSNEIKRTPLKLELEKLFDTYYNDINTNINNSNDNDKSINESTLILSLCCILIIIIVLYIFKKKKYQKDISEAEKTINDNHEAIQNKEKIIKDISKKLEDLSPDNDFEKSYNEFCSTNIYNKVKGTLEGANIMIKNVNEHNKLALSSNDIIVLTKTFNECFPNIISNLKAEYDGITNSDSKYIILFLMNFSDVEIAVLLGLTYSATNKRSNKIKDIFGIEDDLSKFIYEYIKSKF